MSDNGPQFSCGVFREFAQRWDFDHITSSPRRPQGKILVRKAMEDGSDVGATLLNFRNTVRGVYSASPVTMHPQLLLGRRCRTLLPIQQSRLIPKLAAEDCQGCANCTMQKKSTHHLKPLASGDAIRMKLQGQDTWTLGQCTKKLSNRSYVGFVQGHTFKRNRRHLRRLKPPTARVMAVRN